MTEWLLSIVGVVFLGVMVDLLYPNGRTNTICKCVFGIIVVFVLIQPIMKLNKINIDDKVSTNTTLISNINKSKSDAVKLEIDNKLEEMGIDGVDVEININLYNIDFTIENIYIDLTNLVLSENLENINKYEVITNEIVKIANVEKERIIFYG